MRLAQPQEDARGLLFGLDTGQQYGRRLLQRGVRDTPAVQVTAAAGDPGRQEVGFLGAVHPGPEIDVVGAQRDPGELGVGVGVLDGQPAAGQYAGAPLGRGQPAGRRLQGSGPARRLQFAGLRVAHEGVLQPVALLRVPEGEPPLVADPLLVDLGVVGRQPPHDLAAPVVRTGRAAARAVLAHRRRGDQVERAGAEAVRGGGERPDRADLDGVAGEVRLEGVALSGADLLEGAALDEFDHRVAGDLVAEAGAARAEHTALTVQQHLCGDRHRLLERPLPALEARLRVADLHRLVLERALTALVADRAVQRVVDQQQLHHPALGLLGHRGGQLRLDHHAVGAGDGAGGHRLALALDLDDALPAGARRVQQRMVAEARDLDAEEFGGADDQRPLGDGDLDAVDRQGDEVLRRDRCLAAPRGTGGGAAVRPRGRDGHAFTPR
ncbi:hypothetical protein Spla01_06963 [Streptomyces platensis]